MQYLLLIWRDYDRPAAESRESALARYQAYTKSLKDAGAFVAGQALAHPNEGATVRNHGEMLRTDGPFAETKEQLAGFYLIDVASQSEAEAWAAKCPGADPGGLMEVRQIWDHG